MSNRKIYVTKNPNGDTRTAGKNVSYEDFCKANESHRLDVDMVMRELASDIEDRGSAHDFTKILHSKQFYSNFRDVLDGNTKEDFTDLPWYKMHVQAERHHLNNHCPEDVNLIDVLEMIVDIVCATKARCGNDSIYTINLPNDILQWAVNNTVELVDDMVAVKTEDDSEGLMWRRGDRF